LGGDLAEAFVGGRAIIEPFDFGEPGVDERAEAEGVVGPRLKKVGRAELGAAIESRRAGAFEIAAFGFERFGELDFWRWRVEAVLPHRPLPGGEGDCEPR
jgi:hypothetical protein